MSLFLQIKVPRGILSIEQHESLSDIDVKELHMKKILIQYGLCALAVALMAVLAQAQPAGIQAAFGKDAGTLSGKFTGLARVMSGKYDWKPGTGVRSVGDVFNLIVWGERRARRSAFGHTEHVGTARAHHRSREITGGSEGLLRQSAKSDYGTFGQRPANA